MDPVRSSKNFIPNEVRYPEVSADTNGVLLRTGFRRDNNGVLAWSMGKQRLTFTPCKSYFVRDGQVTSIPIKTCP